MGIAYATYAPAHPDLLSEWNIISKCQHNEAIIADIITYSEAINGLHLGTCKRYILLWL